MDLLLEDDILKSIYGHLKNGTRPSDLLEDLTRTWINFPSLLNEFGGILHDHASDVESTENSGLSPNLNNIFALEENQEEQDISIESSSPLSFSHEFFLSLFSQQISLRSPNFSINDERLRIDAFFLQNGPSNELREVLLNHGAIVARVLSNITSKLDNEPSLYLDLLTQSIVGNHKCFQKLTSGIAECFSESPSGCEQFLEMLLASLEDGLIFGVNWVETLIALLGRPIQLERFILMLVVVFHEDAYLKVGGALLHSALSLVASMDAELLQVYLRFQLSTSTHLLDGIVDLLRAPPFSREAFLKGESAMNAAFALCTLTRSSEWFVDSVFWLVTYTHQHSFQTGLSIPLGATLGHCCHYASWILSPSEELVEFPTLLLDILHKLWSTPILPFFVIKLLRDNNWPNNGIDSTSTIGVRYEFLKVLVECFPSMEASLTTSSFLDLQHSRASSLLSLPIEIVEQLLVSIPIATDMEVILLFCWLNHRVGHPLISSITSELVLLEGKITVFIVELAMRHGPAVALPVLLFLVIHFELLPKSNIFGSSGVTYEIPKATHNDQSFAHAADGSISSALTLQFERDLFSSMIFVDYLLGTIDELKSQTYPRIIKLLRASSCRLPHAEQSEIIQQIYNGYEVKQPPLVHDKRACGDEEISSDTIGSESQLTWLASALLFHN